MSDQTLLARQVLSAEVSNISFTLKPSWNREQKLLNNTRKSGKHSKLTTKTAK